MLLNAPSIRIPLGRVQFFKLRVIIEYADAAILQYKLQLCRNKPNRFDNRFTYLGFIDLNADPLQFLRFENSECLNFLQVDKK